jgi:hypothetical protein
MSGGHDLPSCLTKRRQSISMISCRFGLTVQTGLFVIENADDHLGEPVEFSRVFFNLGFLAQVSPASPVASGHRPNSPSLAATNCIILALKNSMS